MREAGDAVFDRQGQRRDAASRDEGVLSGAAAVSAAARRHDLEVPATCTSCANAWRSEHGLELLVYKNPEGVAQGINPFTTARRSTPTSEDAGAEAGARQIRLRRGLRRRAPRRGEEPRQGAHLLVPQRAAPLGPEEPAPRALDALQHAQAQGREHPRVPDLELDRARHLAVHLPRRHPDRAALLRGRASRRRARRHADHGRRRAHAAARRARSR